MSLTTDVKEYALHIGFTKIGITTAEPFTDFEVELATRGNVYNHWKERFAVGARPKEMFGPGRSVIVLAYDYAQHAFPEPLTNMIARAYLARCYLPLPDSVHGMRLQLFKNFLHKNHCSFSDDKNSLILRRAAARSGVANFGRNNFAYVDGVGSFVILYGFIVDKELDYDIPTMDCKCPKDCRKCIDACPTKAIYEPFKLNPSRCIGFNNWMRRENENGMLHTTVPLELREQIGVHVHGCDVCQEVCPRNKKKVDNSFPADPFLEMLKDKITLSGLLRMPDGYYQQYVHPVMYNYIKHKKLFQRNAAIAMGNTKDERYLVDLGPAMQNAEETVRIPAAWALGKIGGAEAKNLLEKQHVRESSPQVKKEISLALARL